MQRKLCTPVQTCQAALVLADGYSRVPHRQIVLCGNFRFRAGMLSIRREHRDCSRAKERCFLMRTHCNGQRNMVPGTHIGGEAGATATSPPQRSPRRPATASWNNCPRLPSFHGMRSRHESSAGACRLRYDPMRSLPSDAGRGSPSHQI